MAKAGFCSSCSADVWLREDGCCQAGHPPTDISAVREVPEPSQPLPVPAPIPTEKPRRRGLVVGLLLAGLLVVIALCALTVSLSAPLLRQGGAVADEWKGRLAKDYPGWKSVGFNVRSFSGTSGSSTDYAFALVPPGRDFVMGITYRSEGGQPAVSQDEVFRSGAAYNARADSLLDYMDANYVKQGRDVTSVTSDSSGEVTVNWRRVTNLGCMSSTVGDFDRLTFDESANSWQTQQGAP